MLSDITSDQPDFTQCRRCGVTLATRLLSCPSCGANQADSLDPIGWFPPNSPAAKSRLPAPRRSITPQLAAPAAWSTPAGAEDDRFYSNYDPWDGPKRPRRIPTLAVVAVAVLSAFAAAGYVLFRPIEPALNVAPKAVSGSVTTQQAGQMAALPRVVPAPVPVPVPVMPSAPAVAPAPVPAQVASSTPSTLSTPSTSSAKLASADVAKPVVVPPPVTSAPTVVHGPAPMPAPVPAPTVVAKQPEPVLSMPKIITLPPEPSASAPTVVAHAGNAAASSPVAQQSQSTATHASPPPVAAVVKPVAPPAAVASVQTPAAVPHPATTQSAAVQASAAHASSAAGVLAAQQTIASQHSESPSTAAPATHAPVASSVIAQTQAQTPTQPSTPTSAPHATAKASSAPATVAQASTPQPLIKPPAAVTKTAQLTNPPATKPSPPSKPAAASKPVETVAAVSHRPTSPAPITDTTSRAAKTTQDLIRDQLRADVARNLQIAQAMMQKGNLTAAESRISGVLTVQPKNRDALDMRADLSAREQQRDAALDVARGCAYMTRWTCAWHNAGNALVLDSSSAEAKGLVAQAMHEVQLENMPSSAQAVSDAPRDAPHH